MEVQTSRNAGLSIAMFDFHRSEGFWKFAESDRAILGGSCGHLAPYSKMMWSTLIVIDRLSQCQSFWVIANHTHCFFFCVFIYRSTSKSRFVTEGKDSMGYGWGDGAVPPISGESLGLQMLTARLVARPNFIRTFNTLKLKHPLYRSI